MQIPRFSLANVMAFIFVISLPLAAIGTGSVTCLRISCTVTIAILLLAILAAAVGSAQNRGFWIGFALFGWAVLLLPKLDSNFSYYFITAQVLDWSKSAWSDAKIAMITVGNGGPEADVGFLNRAITMLDCLVFGLLGGFAGHAIQGKKRESTRSES